MYACPALTTPAGPTTPPPLSAARYCLPPGMTTSASHGYTTFQGSITQPAYLLLLCFTRRFTVSVRRIRYQPADGLWLGGTCTHWLIMTNFMEAPFAPQSQGLSNIFLPVTPCRLLAILLILRQSQVIPSLIFLDSCCTVSSNLSRVCDTLILRKITV